MEKRQLDMQKAFAQFRTQFSDFLQNLPLFNPNAPSLKTNLESKLNVGSSTQLGFRQAVSSGGGPLWARISQIEPGAARTGGMSTAAIEERLAGVSLYALTNEAEEFVLVSGVRTKKSIGLFCFREEDAEALLDQMKAMSPGMRSGSRVVPVALNQVFQLKLDGVAFRLIPESSQVMHALKEMQKAGVSSKNFNGVPVFQSRSLILKSEDKRYRPVFFRKEDLEKSLSKASQQQNRVNPTLRQGDIQVSVLEDIIKGMKENSSQWGDVVFVPPGFDVSSDPIQQ
uniref:Tic22-like protein n=1 Tax=Kalanchoe fedtschenkoi TaxID=63787 RepID=A0A7N0UQ20_KALFE